MDVEEPRVRMASENSERIEQALASVVPFVVVQRGRITYINEAGATCLGYENGDPPSGATLVVTFATRSDRRESAARASW